MTEPLPPLSDEDLSAALDGLAGPDVEARLQTDPSARERLDALRVASHAIGQAPAVPDPEVLDALIARAVEVGIETTGDVEYSPAAHTSPDGVVTPLAPRRRTSAGMQRWIVAAVVVAVAAIGLGLVYAGTHDNTIHDAAIGALEDRNAARRDVETTESTIEDTESSESGGSNDADTSESHSYDGSEPPSDPANELPAKELDANAEEPADLDQLGSFDDVSSLRTVLRARFPQDAPLVEGDRPNNAAVTRCNDFIQTVLGSESLAPEPDEVGQAFVSDDEYLIYEYSVTDTSSHGSKLITAADPDSCDLLFTFMR